MIEETISGAVKGFFASIWDKIWPDKKVIAVSPGSDSDLQEKKALTPITYVSRPTPNDIGKALREAAPYQSALLKKSYVGLGVEWILNLHDFFGERDGITRVQMLFEGDMLVYIHVSLDLYPFFKTSNREHQFRIKGIIESADNHDLTLKAIDSIEPI
jgi:hypothetical protein